MAQAGLSSRLGSLSRLLASVALAALAIFASPSALHAQSHNKVLLGAGASIPAGIFDAYANIGWSVMGAYERQLGSHPTSLRVDVGYSRNTDTTGVGFHETTRLITAMASVVHPFPGAKPHLYILVGAGYFGRRFSSDDPADPPIDDSRWGLQVGEGFEFRIKSVKLFAEGRFVSGVGPQPLRFFPVIVGMRFGGTQ